MPGVTGRGASFTLAFGPADAVLTEPITLYYLALETELSSADFDSLIGRTVVSTDGGATWVQASPSSQATPVEIDALERERGGPIRSLEVSSLDLLVTELYVPFGADRLRLSAPNEPAGTRSQVRLSRRWVHP